MPAIPDYSITPDGMDTMTCTHQTSTVPTACVMWTAYQGGI